MKEIESLLQEGIALIKAGQYIKGRALLQEVAKLDPKNSLAWLWLSAAVDSEDEKRQCLEKVLEIDPRNPYARKGLQKLGENSTKVVDTPDLRVSSPRLMSDKPEGKSQVVHQAKPGEGKRKLVSAAAIFALLILFSSVIFLVSIRDQSQETVSLPTDMRDRILTRYEGLEAYRSPHIERARQTNVSPMEEWCILTTLQWHTAYGWVDTFMVIEMTRQPDGSLQSDILQNAHWPEQGMSVTQQEISRGWNQFCR